MELLRGKRILVVDDEPELRALIADDLRDLGCLVTEAAGGFAALAILTNSEIDAVVSDVRMPGGSGVDLLAGIAARATPRPVVLLVSGFMDISMAEALARGAVAVLGKPYEVDVLAATLAKAMVPVETRWGQRLPRVAATAAVELIMPDYAQASSAQLVNLGNGGMSIAAPVALPPVGTVVNFKVAFNGPSLASIEGVGILRWTQPQPVASGVAVNCGIEFTELTDSCRGTVIAEIARLNSSAFIPLVNA